ncbi:hypothetical protein, partial [uncultured Holdemania sp.]|uniref:hypothetical protein n=1 Tax=uncultured Holdemania sp. TaxID=527664 RepID=UPI0028063FF4
EIQDDYNSFARVNAVRVFAKVNAISFSLKAAFTFSIHNTLSLRYLLQISKQFTKFLYYD